MAGQQGIRRAGPDQLHVYGIDAHIPLRGPQYVQQPEAFQLPGPPADRAHTRLAAPTQQLLWCLYGHAEPPPLI